MSAQPEELDPFAESVKSPALSFDGAPVGTVFTGTVTSPPKLQQTRDYNTNEPAFWPVKTPGETPNPKMAVVIGLEVNGEPRSVWAPKYPAYLFEALAAAQTAAGARIAVGGTLAIKFTGEIPNTDAKKHAAKTYAARYTPPVAPDAFADGDPWSTPAAQSAPAAAPAQPATPVAAAPWDTTEPPF